MHNRFVSGRYCWLSIIERRSTNSGRIDTYARLIEFDCYRRRLDVYRVLLQHCFELVKTFSAIFGRTCLLVISLLIYPH